MQETGDNPDKKKDNDPINWRDLILRTVLFMVIVLAVYGTAVFLFRAQLKGAGVWLSDKFGYFGVALYTYLVDAFIVPTTADVIFPFTMEWNPYILLSAMSAASILGGFTGYWIARSFNHFNIVKQMTRSYHRRGEAIVNRYGSLAIVIAGLTPIPFSTICWIAGLLRMPAGRVFLASLSRIPRMVIYYVIIKSGINLMDLVFG